MSDEKDSDPRPPRMRGAAGKNSLVPSATGIRRAAMDWLARREYARCELEQKLHRRFPDATAAIGPVLDQLEHEGLLSTPRFIDNFTRSRIRAGYGPLRIAAELRRRGVVPGSGRDDDDSEGFAGDVVAAPASAALPVDSDLAPADWLVQARDARRRRFGESLPVGPAERNRQMAFLQRRGFPVGICRQACLPPRDSE